MSSVPSVQLVLVTVPAVESMVVVPAALQFHVGDVAKFAAHGVASTLTDGGSEFKVRSQPFCAFPSQSSVPAPHDPHDPPEQVWLVVHVAVVHVVPQLESRLRDFSQPLD